MVLDFAVKHKDKVEATVAKPGLISAPGKYLWNAWISIISVTMSVPSIDLRDISAAMLNQVVHGFEKDPLMNDDLVRIAKGINKAERGF
jgi:hypothetical protein